MIPTLRSLPWPEDLRARLRVLRILSEGAGGTVLLCQDGRLSRPVILKVSLSPMAVDPNQAQRFLNEANILSRLSHPQVVRILDAGRGEGFAYLLMEYLQGPSLAVRLDRLGIYSAEEAARILIPLARALDEVHTRGVFHRDIKPANIVLEPQRGAVLIDFGLARTELDYRTLTQAGEVVGTPSYLAPEIIIGKPASALSDIYSLGLVLYTMLAGHSPFVSDDITQVLMSQVNEPPPPIPGMPGWMQPILDMSLAKSPQERFASAAGMAGALQDAMPRSRDGSSADVTKTVTDSERTGERIRTAPASRRTLIRLSPLLIFPGSALVALLLLVSTGGSPELEHVELLPIAPGRIEVRGRGTGERLTSVWRRGATTWPGPAGDLEAGRFSLATDLEGSRKALTLELSVQSGGRRSRPVMEQVDPRPLYSRWGPEVFAAIGRFKDLLALPEEIKRDDGRTTAYLGRRLDQVPDILKGPGAFRVLEQRMRVGEDPLEKRLSTLCDLGHIQEVMIYLAGRGQMLPPWSEGFLSCPWIFSLQILPEMARCMKHEFTGPHALTESPEILAVKFLDHTRTLTWTFDMVKRGTRVFLMIDVYKMRPYLLVRLRLNGHTLPALVTDRSRSEQVRSRHYMELTPGLLEPSGNTLELRLGYVLGRSLPDSVNVRQVGLCFMDGR